MRQTEPTDRDLWAALAVGDEAAFGTLFDRHSRAVYNHAFRLSGSWSVAEDVIQASAASAMVPGKPGEAQARLRSRPYQL